MKKSFLIIGVFILILVGCTHFKDKEKISDQFTPIIDNNGADPWLLKNDNYYYYTKTTGNDVTLWRSEELSTVVAGERKVIWKLPSEFESAWAPELHYLDDQWIVYVALNKGGETHRMYALTNSSKDPYQGEWKLQAIAGMTEHFAIDGTILETNQGRYFIWSGWERYENVAQNLYIAPMEGIAQISGERQLLSRPEFEWEKKQTPLINEGPEIFIAGDTINLVYSASGSWDDDYSLGLLTLNVKDNPLDVKRWSKESKPIMAKTDFVFGPGHNGFVRDKEGKPWIVYHSARWSHSGWERSIRIQPLSLKGEKIDTMLPLVSEQYQRLPSGDLKRQIYSAIEAKQSGDFKMIEYSKGESLKSIVGFANREDELTFNVNVKKSGDYIFAVYAKTVDNYTPDNLVPVLMTVDGEPYSTLLPPSDNYSPLYQKVSLKKGEHIVTISSEVGVDEIAINRLEVIGD